MNEHSTTDIPEAKCPRCGFEGQLADTETDWTPPGETDWCCPDCGLGWMWMLAHGLGSALDETNDDT